MAVIWGCKVIYHRGLLYGLVSKVNISVKAVISHIAIKWGCIIIYHRRGLGYMGL